MQKINLKRIIIWTIGIAVIIAIGVLLYLARFPMKRASDTYEYTIHCTYIEINRYTGDEEVVTIPEYLAEKPVKVLGSYLDERGRERGAFYANETIKKVYMPDSITEMSEGSFKSCVNLEEVRISSDLNAISHAAFWNCNSIIKINIPEGVEKIEQLAFAFSDNLEDITLPKSLKRIGSDAFRGCTKLDHVVIPSGVEKIGGDAFEGTKWKSSFDEDFVIVGKNVLLYYGGYEKTVKIPEGVEYIASGIFRDNSHMVRLILPESLKEIDSYTLCECETLQYVAVKNPQMKYIDYGEFKRNRDHAILLVGAKGSTTEAFATRNKILYSDDMPDD